ncbi:MAG TPA: hypothetical protein VHL11_16815, partial [Phototrophicaceae bacterium]|jgi:hypothetical protein|nr:hypothetical protein [Phototrophicaceae bacterium]
MTPADDPKFDPSNAQGGGGIWLYWLTLIGEGLLKYGYDAQAADLLHHIMTAQVQVLKQEGHFQEFYHSDEPRGSGESGSLAGIIPLALLNRVIGVYILSPSQVYTGGTFIWYANITIRQHGVIVTRRSDGTSIAFPSGHTVNRPSNATTWETITDPTPAVPTVPVTVTMPVDPVNPEQMSGGKVMIQVEIDHPVTKSVAEPQPESDEKE